jgi:hypothetical protein
MFGLNPGIDAKLSPLEDKEARKSWEHYIRLYVNFYEFPQFRIRSPYYVATHYDRRVKIPTIIHEKVIL